MIDSPSPVRYYALTALKADKALGEVVALDTTKPVDVQAVAKALAAQPGTVGFVLAGVAHGTATGSGFTAFSARRVIDNYWLGKEITSANIQDAAFASVRKAAQEALTSGSRPVLTPGGTIERAATDHHVIAIA